MALGAVLALMAMSIDADAAPVVHSEISETRACLPVAGGTLVGTAGGLAKLDERGQVRAVWTASDGLPGTRIEMISRVGDEIWVGADNGVARVTLGDQLTIASRYAGHPVRDVLRVGSITYIATWGGGVRRIDGTAVPFAVATSKKQRSNVLSLARHDGVVYAGTADGLFRIANGKLERVALPAGPSLAIAALFSDGATLWIGTPAGLYAREAKATRPLGGGDIRRIMKLEGVLVVASVGDGLAQLERGRFATLAGAPRGFAMAQTIAEANGAVCAGGLDGTWLRPRGGSWVAVRTQGGRLPSNDISALAYDGERLWVGTFDHGLAVLEPSTPGNSLVHGTWRTIAADKVDTRINALHVDRKSNRVWAATASGLYSIDPGTGAVARFARDDGLPSRSVLALAGMRDGRVLVGTSAGAAIVGTGRPVRLAKGQDLGNVWAVAEDASGALWLGTTTGLYRGSETATEWKRFSLATGHLRDDWVTSIAVVESGAGRTLYAGTYHGGITRFDIGDTVSATQLGEGWINPAGLLVDGGRVFAATMDGLVIGDGQTAASTTQLRLPGKDVTAVARAGATLFVATRRGLAAL